MRPLRARRRVLESLAKAKALLVVQAETRLQHHALSEAVLNQIASTWLALIRQVGDAHGLKPESIQSLIDLTSQLSQRQLVSLEADMLESLASDPNSWLAAFWSHRAKVSCPDESTESLDSDQIPMTDTSTIDQLKITRYSAWVDELSDLIDEFQNRFDES